MKRWYRIVNKADRAEIWIYETIGDDFWSGGGVTAKKFQEELSGIKAKLIDLHINSPGGQVFEGITIYNLLKQHEAKITAYVDGLAASIASVIALAGDKVVMAANALFMIHNPSGLVMGQAADMRKMADVLDKIRSTMSGVYAGKSGKPEDEINEMLDAETWMTAAEAKEAGFIDEIADEMDLAACARFVPVMAKAGFKHIPENLSGERRPPENERDLERVLRDAGYTRTQAKSIIAEGFRSALRDAEPPADASSAAEPLRDAEPQKPAKIDRVADLLVRAERAAPSTKTSQEDKKI
jgi:ATP-dependent Clp endopeptidase proteolytic subunit ClpP